MEKLTAGTIAKILCNHSIKCFFDGRKIYAVSDYVTAEHETKSEITDVTNYTVEELRDFLGY